MKKILAVVMACILAFACMVPGVALDKSAAKSDAPPTGTVLKIGAWPQTQVTNLIICMLLKDKLDKTTPSWKSDVLPDGTSVQYADVYFEAVSNAPSTQKTYRVVQINGTYQWYRWEPLEWEAVEYHDGKDVYRALVCTSVVAAAQNDTDAVFVWLKSTFFQTAFTADERAECHCIGAPLAAITNGEAALVGDYAALYGLDGTSYFELYPDVPVYVTDPQAYMYSTCCPPDNNTKGGSTGSAKSTDSKGAAKGAVCAPAKVILQRSGEIIGVRPMLVLRSQAEEKAGGVICCILRWLFGHSH